MQAFASFDYQLEVAVGNLMHEAAQRIVLPAFVPGEIVSHEFKTPGEAVTAIDHLVESYLWDGLSKLLPGVAIVGEESAHHDPQLLENLSRGACWIIDPLDGTGNFACGKQPFGMLVSLAQDGLPIAGWILDPIRGRLCSAWAGGGARVDMQTFQTKGAQSKAPRVALTSLFQGSEARNHCAAILDPICTLVAAPRCAADIYPRVAGAEPSTEVSLDGAVFTRTIAWDHAAGIIFLNEAGGHAARSDGSAYRCDDPNGGLVIARDPVLFEKLIDQLSHNNVSLAYT